MRATIFLLLALVLVSPPAHAEEDRFLSAEVEAARFVARQAVENPNGVHFPEYAETPDEQGRSLAHLPEQIQVVRAPLKRAYQLFRALVHGRLFDLPSGRCLGCINGRAARSA